MSRIIIKNTSTANSIPEGLKPGELAVNLNDKLLYTADAYSAVFPINKTIVVDFDIDETELTKSDVTSILDTLTLSVSSLSLDYSGTSQTINVSSNVAWEVVEIS